MKILVADDDAVSRRLMQGILQKSGYEVILAADGLSACHELTQREGPRLALIDWIMPELDGPGVCREVRRRRDESYVYIALLTARQSNADIVAGLEAGADDYLTKPCHPAELKARLLTGRRILRYEDKLVEAREAMWVRATHDALTSLWNRAAILSHLQAAVDRAAHKKDSVSVLLCDIDHFKEINDTYGHLAGDAVLAEVSATLMRSLRKDDRIGRYGGEEFLAVLEGCRAEDLSACAEHMRRCVAETRFEATENALRVSVSIGGASFHGNEGRSSAEQLLKLADQALYRAKGRGRNRVSLIGPADPAAGEKPPHPSLQGISADYLQSRAHSGHP